MDVPRSSNPKPSWYGESIGHYEDDTLVVDTIGQTDRTFVDNYRTPHSEKLHVIERYHLTDCGKFLQVDIQVDDPDAFTMPWTAIQRYRRASAAQCSRRFAQRTMRSFSIIIFLRQPVPTSDDAASDGFFAGAFARNRTCS